jgi:hypothetical protein
LAVAGAFADTDEERLDGDLELGAKRRAPTSPIGARPLPVDPAFLWITRRIKGADDTDLQHAVIDGRVAADYSFALAPTISVRTAESDGTEREIDAVVAAADESRDAPEAAFQRGRRRDQCHTG